MKISCSTPAMSMCRDAGYFVLMVDLRRVTSLFDIKNITLFDMLLLLHIVVALKYNLEKVGILHLFPPSNH